MSSFEACQRGQRQPGQLSRRLPARGGRGPTRSSAERIGRRCRHPCAMQRGREFWARCGGRCPRLRGPPNGEQLLRRPARRRFVTTQHGPAQCPVGRPSQSSARSTVSLLIAASPSRRSKPHHWRTVGRGLGRPEKLRPLQLLNLCLEILSHSPTRPPRLPSHPARLLHPPSPLRPPRYARPSCPPRHPRPYRHLRHPRHPRHPRPPRPPQHSTTRMPRPELYLDSASGRGQLSRLQRHPSNSWSCRMAPNFHASPVCSFRRVPDPRLPHQPPRLPG